MGAHDGLPPLGGFPTAYDALQRAFNALSPAERQYFLESGHIVYLPSERPDSPFYRPYLWERRRQHREYMKQLEELDRCDRAAHGLAVKLLRMATNLYRRAELPVARRVLVDKNQTKVYGLTTELFAKRVEHYAIQLSHPGCVPQVSYEPSSRQLRLELILTQEPRFVLPPRRYSFVMVDTP